MNKEDIAKMARQAGMLVPGHRTDIEELERFAYLVAAAERDRIKAANAPEIEAINAHIKALEDAIAAEREAIDNAYRERNQLVALLSTLFPSGKAKTAIEGWDEAWHGCVYIDFPWGQASWHYHADDDWMFAHLPPYNKAWDGHTTEAKYAAIATAIRARGNQ